MRRLAYGDDNTQPIRKRQLWIGMREARVREKINEDKLADAVAAGSLTKLEEEHTMAHHTNP